MQDSSTYLLADGFLPIIIFAIIAGGQFLFKALASKDDAPDDEVAEAERKHQEEMRRKIRERMEAARQANQGKTPTAQTTINEVREILEERPRMQEPVIVEAPDVVSEKSFASMSEDSVDAIQKRIQALQQKGMDAQDKIAAIQSKTKINTPMNVGNKAHRQGSLRTSIRRSLSNPRSAQQAIVMAEILGKPKSLQQD